MQVWLESREAAVDLLCTLGRPNANAGQSGAIVRFLTVHAFFGRSDSTSKVGVSSCYLVIWLPFVSEMLTRPPIACTPFLGAQTAPPRWDPAKPSQTHWAAICIQGENSVRPLATHAFFGRLESTSRVRPISLQGFSVCLSRCWHPEGWGCHSCFSGSPSMFQSFRLC